MNAPLNKNDFIGLESVNWLYSGAETPPLRCSADAVQKYFQARATGPGGRAQTAAKETSFKNNLSQMLNLGASNIALLGNTSEAVFSIALSLDWKTGDNVVINTLDFPAGVLPWLQLKKRGVEVRVVEHENWNVTPQQMLDRVDERTRLVMTSWVSYLSGAKMPCEQIYDALKNTETLFIVDVTQALGAFKFDGTQADFVVGSSYKWLLGTHGVGILAVNPARTQGIVPQVVGWRGISDMFAPTRFEKFTYHEDARRFETGYPSYSTIWAMEASTNYLLNAGVENCSSHILEMGTLLINSLEANGYEVMTPKDPAHRAGNIALVCPRGEEVSAALAAENIYAWGGDNRLRASIHAFVDQSDIDQFMNALKRHFPGQ
mgnify:CR=1 FL=1